MSQKKYWKGLGELNNSEAHQEVVQNEFRQELPFEVHDSLLEATTPRRDFLKYLGFSTAAAMLAASCEMPVRKAIPYAIKPEEIVPGVPNYYASTFVDGGDYCAIVIKTRDGRPIKIEGNEKSTITRGGTSARVQASVLSLYDNARLRQPHVSGKPVDMMEAVDRQVREALAATAKPVVLLTGTILSPTTREVINQFLGRFPGSRHVTYDPVSYSGMLLANQASYGKRALPSYHFDKAATIVSIGADFLGTWLSPVEFAKQYSLGRKVSAQNPRMSRHYQFEPNHTISGAAADFRAVARPSELGAVAVALYNTISTGAAPAFSNKRLNELIVKAANDLKTAGGLVVSGSNDVAVQTVVNAINDRIGANGTTVNWAVSANYKQGIDADMVQLVQDMKAGNVGALLVHGVNPAYEYADQKSFTEGIAKVGLTISFAERMDETAQLCKFVVPDHHFLESWGDAEPKTGFYSLMQPGIAPIFKTRAFQDSLMHWAGATETYGDFWKRYWQGKLGSQQAVDQALQDGVIEPAQMPTGGAGFGGDVNGAIAQIAARKTDPNKVEVLVYEKVSIGRGGCWSNNPWLQEMPDPITKATWDNYACISPAMAKKLGHELTTYNEVETKHQLVSIKANGQELILPLVVVPGMHDQVVAVALGYGRHEKVGKAAANTGKRAYQFLAWNGSSFERSQVAEFAEAPGTYELAITQTHHSYEGRPIIREYTLDNFIKQPDALFKSREAEIGHYAHLPWAESHGGDHAAADAHGAHAAPAHEPTSGNPSATELDAGFRENGTLYPTYVSPGIHWGMSIDLNSCIGCGACVIGCQAENNVSVVGKTHVMRAQEMHWLQIDRYFAGDPEDANTIQTVFQPMLCQHCDNAPCENVCPVNATNHSSEGLNQMAYNRCIGTKYCANNCPYKVRHFNWMDWNGADSFDDNLYEDGRRDGMNDNLTRMVLNPDVTVRSRGVMEKCTFCVQRLQDAKLTAKREGRVLRDGEARTACQQACPTDAILFGNVNDRDSAIYKLRAQEQKERTYYVLEHLHSLPNVNYLSRIRNNDLVVAGNEATDKILEQHI